MGRAATPEELSRWRELAEAAQVAAAAPGIAHPRLAKARKAARELTIPDGSGRDGSFYRLHTLATRFLGAGPSERDEISTALHGAAAETLTRLDRIAAPVRDRRLPEEEA